MSLITSLLLHFIPAQYMPLLALVCFALLAWGQYLALTKRFKANSPAEAIINGLVPVARAVVASYEAKYGITNSTTGAAPQNGAEVDATKRPPDGPDKVQAAN